MTQSNSFKTFHKNHWGRSTLQLTSGAKKFKLKTSFRVVLLSILLSIYVDKIYDNNFKIVDQKAVNLTEINWTDLWQYLRKTLSFTAKER